MLEVSIVNSSPIVADRTRVRSGTGPVPVLLGRSLAGGALGCVAGALTILMVGAAARVLMSQEPWLALKVRALPLIGAKAMLPGFSLAASLTGLGWLVVTAAAAGVLLGLLTFAVPESWAAPLALVSALGAFGADLLLVRPELPQTWQAYVQAALPGQLALLQLVVPALAAVIGALWLRFHWSDVFGRASIALGRDWRRGARIRSESRQTFLKATPASLQTRTDASNARVSATTRS